MTENTIQPYQSTNSRSDIIATYDDLERAARAMAASGYFQDARQVSQCVVKILAAREIGLGSFAGVTGVHVIKGKPTFSANIMANKVKSSGRYNYRVTELSERACSIEYFEMFDGKWQSIGVSTFNIDDAKKAGTQNMDKFPRNMLFARAMSNGVRWYCPDVMNGNVVYTPEELGAAVDEDGNVVDGNVVEGNVVEGDFAPVVDQTPQAAEPERKEQQMTKQELSAAVQDTRPTRDQILAELPSLTIEEACKAKTSAGVLYCNMQPNVLEKVISNLWKSLLNNGLDPEQHADQVLKLASANEVLKAKQDGSLN